MVKEKESRIFGCNSHDVRAGRIDLFSTMRTRDHANSPINESKRIDIA